MLQVQHKTPEKKNQYYTIKKMYLVNNETPMYETTPQLPDDPLQQSETTEYYIIFIFWGLLVVFFLFAH
jgi:hypothetical protein